ncbi:hypothetical protein P152DRAFT_451818 [Eremomyces bilateralis CBS 781.70]|uniref:C2H2-type domain-containing protein n=1 Tax=Eremomyces bilateralis CBS 781.70 TaxID=1392243 RepID=A0A6G1FVD3_9PEZI|nr:uncharacterized protein P152DRAFT_451818 [Eremomyces bilateralis CBS 781.70]KAF1809621.1 hypothetical protein P152DRAFT_451818 [Eremomyces bilateralis CBS 781.70]
MNLDAGLNVPRVDVWALEYWCEGLRRRDTRFSLGTPDSLQHRLEFRKLESSDTPPPLTYSPLATERGRESTADNTPVSTPTYSSTSCPPPRHRKIFGKPKNRDLASWHRKVGAEAAGGPSTSSPFLESEPLFDHPGASTFPLFAADDDEAQLAPESGNAMTSSSSPIDIATPQRVSSTSPRNHTSNLTSALRQEANAGMSQPRQIRPNERTGAEHGMNMFGRQDSIGNGTGLLQDYYLGARPISVAERNRRESAVGSLGNGMSWGGISVGSYIPNDTMMAGTSPFGMFQSPSSFHHSSSYLPKVEATMLRNYTCCDIPIDSLHDLLQHYEEHHSNQSDLITSRPSQSGQGGFGPGPSRLAMQSGGMTGHRQPSLQGYNQSQFDARSQAPYTGTPLSPVQDRDPLEEMDFDDAGAPVTPMQQHFNVSDLRQPRVNMNNSQQFHPGLRTTSPTIPAGVQAFSNLQNNPTVSSVNTPTLGTRSAQQPQSPDYSNAPSGDQSTQSAMGTDYDIGNFNMSGFGDSQSNDSGTVDWGNMNVNNMNIGGGMSGLTIDEPARNLNALEGMTPQQMQQALAMQYGIQNQHMMAGGGRNFTTAPSGLQIPEKDPKPFKCPVIGCEKTYKNQNGLKYHKQHGHQNQQLRKNEDGTYSIVDPETSIPYPGTLGMEKEKPYRCQICGKRYKNLNGLKYHKQHQPGCNPDLQPQINGPTNNNNNSNGPSIAGGGNMGSNPVMPMGVSGMGSMDFGNLEALSSGMGDPRMFMPAEYPAGM